MRVIRKGGDESDVEGFSCEESPYTGTRYVMASGMEAFRQVIFFMKNVAIVTTMLRALCTSRIMR